MNDTLKLGGVALVAALCGFGGGRAWPGGDEADERTADPQAAAAESPAAESPAAEPPAAAAEVAARAHDDANAQRCLDAQLELRFVEARREVERTRDTSIRRSFEEGTQLEQSLAWTELAESVSESCLPSSLSLSFIECSEYPCVAVFAGPEGASAAQRDELEFAANEGLEQCGPLSAALGEDDIVEAAVFLPFPVSCPEGDDEQAWVLLLLDPQGAALPDFMSSPADRSEAARINRWIYRRANDVDRKWICADESPPDDAP